MRPTLLLLVLAATTATQTAAQTFPEPLRNLGSWLALEGRGQLVQGHEWRDRFGGLARPGADLSRVVDEWTYWLLSGNDSPLAKWRAEPYMAPAARLFARRLAGDHPTTPEWEAAETLAHAASYALEDDAAAEAAHAVSSACIAVVLELNSLASNTASIAAAVAVEAAAQRDGNYDRSDAAYEAARTVMANKLAELIAAK